MCQVLGGMRCRRKHAKQGKLSSLLPFCFLSRMYQDGRTPLHCAASADSLECFRVLVGLGADVNARGLVST